jgi:hypothetical protein
MFLRAKTRLKDGKEHGYWSIVENRRTQGGRMVQRQVLYLGEINDGQRASWCKTIEVVQEGEVRPKQIAIFPEDRVAPPLDCDIVRSSSASCNYIVPGNGVPAGWPVSFGIS